MYIKTIVLDGFKSYGQRTEISGFDRQFNAITGLNGSGKSNVLDSICFVLGISNLSHVRVGNLQDLIYKSGQGGINKASVSITFDNRNPDQSPAGFENVSEITVSRQIVMGGKSKYRINGAIAQNKKIHDLFCSVQLNVNNPHFLIMQGKITKVLNMKAFEILGMIEEAAGTKMYEEKKAIAQKTIQKKDDKLKELEGVINEELSPKLDKLKGEREKFLELKSLERRYEHSLNIYQAWEYLACKRNFTEARRAQEDGENKLKQCEEELKNYKNQILEMDELIEQMTRKAESEVHENLQKAETALKTVEKSQAKINATLKSISQDIDIETKKKTQLQQNLTEDEKTLKQKQKKLSEVEDFFIKLKTAEESASQAYNTAKKRYEALNVGMELNDEGEAQTLLEQLMNAREKATEAYTTMKQTSMRLKFCQEQLNEKRKRRASDANETQTQKQQFDAAVRDVKQLEAATEKLHVDDVRHDELQVNKRRLIQEIRVMRDKVDDFDMRKPHVQFNYTDPEPNFNRNSVFGVVCRLIQVKNEEKSVAIETTAGSKLYNVVVDSDVTAKKLLQRGNLQRRTTFIPLNKIQARSMNDDLVKFAQNLVGKDKVQSAMSCLNYDNRLKVVMEFIFGNVFICKDLDVAKTVAFHERIRRKCVTLDGDVVDPAGILSGGAREKGEALLKQLDAIKRVEEELQVKEEELKKIEAEIGVVARKRDEFSTMARKLDLKRHELNLMEKRLQMTTHYQQQEEIGALSKEIEELTEKIRLCQVDEAKFKEKTKELEGKVENSKGGKEEQLKQAKNEMLKLKTQAEKTQVEWKQKESDYDVFNLEIEELKKSLEETKEQIRGAEEAIKRLEEKRDEVGDEMKEISENVAKLQAEIKTEKGKIADENKHLKQQTLRKEEVQKKITQCEIEMKEQVHRLKKFKDDCKNLKAKESDCEKRTKNEYLKEAKQMTDKDAQELERDIRKSQESLNILRRTVNNKAQAHFEQLEKEFNEVMKKHRIVQQDKAKILQVIIELDKKKEEILKKAHVQISRDFGSIFGTLLPGAGAKLLPPTGQTILQGLEVKVSLGGVWKESLTELSGGQRSLAALSLILAMLLFKPAPLYILDEVDAALDLSHTQNIGNMLKTHFKKSQFIIVSLKDGMFSNANVLFKTQFVDGVSTVTRTVNNTN